jgi:outer membrane protein OmpA-like peptidoglycan-associated protein
MLKGKTVVLMTKAETGSSIVLKDIQFKAGTSELEGENTFEILNEIADFLINQPNLTIRIGGHTDNLGDPTLNKELSLQRATAVRNFLISNGVNFEKLRISGWGGSKPIASNATEAGRNKNRRVELSVEN